MFPVIGQKKLMFSQSVVMTTFGTIASEYKRKEAYEKLPEDARGEKPSLTLLADDSVFYRVVIDGEPRLSTAINYCD